MDELPQEPHPQHPLVAKVPHKATVACETSTWRPLKPGKLVDYVPPDDVVDEDLKCSICLNWPDDPIVLGCSGGHMFCRSCVRSSLCPLDRQPFARTSPPQRPIVAILDRLNVFCPAEGCNWHGLRGSFPDHWERCEFAELECLVCGLRARRGEALTATHHHAESPSAASRAAVEPSTAAQHGSASTERRQEQITRLIEVYEQAERLNACFLVDCTGSMGPHINAVKNQIDGIVHEMQRRLPSMRLNLAFVGYRDHCDGHLFELLPFTPVVADFRAFVACMLPRGGGGDGPEDVHGGVQQACALDWATGDAHTRVLVHIADFPAHGRTFNDCPRDSYPEGDPYGLDLFELLRDLQSKNVQYIFGHITRHTHKMVRVLNEALDGYVSEREMADPGEVAEQVTASLHTATASTVSTLTSRLGDSEPDVPVVLDPVLPDWSTLEGVAVTLHTVQPVHDLSELSPAAGAGATRRSSERKSWVKLAPSPFSQGETRLAHHALLGGFPAVAKPWKREARDEDASDEAEQFERQLALAEVSAVAAFLAQKYSAEVAASGEAVAFLKAEVAVPTSGESRAPFCVEEVIPVDDFKRFSNNIGWWEPDAPEALMKFARWTHEATQGHMMVVDLQGVRTADGWLLTDPCLLCQDVMRFGAGNLGPHAIERCLTALTRHLDAQAPPPPLEPENRVRGTQAARITGGGSAAAPSTGPRSAVSPHAIPAFQPGPNDLLDIDQLIDTLVKVPRAKPGKLVQCDEGVLRNLVFQARQVLLAQPTLLELDAPVKVLGDIHGQHTDLLRHFEANGFPPDSNYLLLGDYVDRGRQSIEALSLLLAYKVKYPENIFLLRGNHECASITRIYGFYDECKRRYNIRLWKTFCAVFDCLPPAALIEDRILCMHGGISPELQSFDQIRSMVRPSDIPDSGLLCDLLWADPDRDVQGWVENDRGVSFTFGPDIVQDFNRVHSLDLIVRAHQVVEDGYEFFADRRLVTVFSAPNYCGEFDNKGALLEVSDDLFCSFRLLGKQEGPAGQGGRLGKAVARAVGGVGSSLLPGYSQPR